MQKTDCKKSIRVCNDEKKRTKKLKNGKCGANIKIMINFDDITKENRKLHNLSWPQVSDNPFRILFVGGRV